MRTALAAALVLAAVAACDDATTPRDAAQAPVTVSGVLTAEQQAIVAAMSVEVTGTGIATPIIVDLAVNGAQVNGTVTVPVGPARTFTVRAYDAAGIETHVGSATQAVVAGTNPPLAVQLVANAASVPIDVTIGSYGVTLTPATASVAVGAEVTLTASVTASSGSSPTGALSWGVLNPTLVTLTVAADGRSAVVRGRLAGETRVVASYEGIAAASTLTVTAPSQENQAPVARANGPYSVRLPSAVVAFSSAGSSDPDGSVVSYLWEFGDGTTSTSANPIKTYSAVGTYTAVLTVTDDDGATATSSATVTVRAENVWPTAFIQQGYRATVGVPLTIQASGSDADGTVTGFTWSYGSAPCTPSSPSVLGTLTCTFTQVGQYSIAVAAVDDEGMTGRSSSTTVTVEPAPGGNLQATSVAAGAEFSCALTSGGTAYCWGANDVGQLGNGTTTPSARPVPVRMPNGVLFTSLRAGSTHACAAANDGNSYCWGGNAAGQLGFGDTQPRTQPTVVPVETRPGSMGYSRSCNSRSGTYYCWGAGFGLAPVAQTPPSGATVYFRTAGGNQSCSYVQAPYPNPPINEIKMISCSDVGGVEVTIPQGVSMGILYVADGYACHTYASQGGMRCFGGNAAGQWGTGTTGSATVATLTSYSPTTFGTNFTCNATSCAGSNASGQLGNGSTASSALTPTSISGGSVSGIVASAGGSHACGIRGGNVYCWGANASGQLGDGTTTLRRVPTAVVSPAP